VFGDRRLRRARRERDGTGTGFDNRRLPCAPSNRLHEIATTGTSIHHEANFECEKQVSERLSPPRMIHGRVQAGTVFGFVCQGGNIAG